MNERSRAATWVAQADNDAAHARHSMQGGFYAQACYSAQQAVEKALKSLLLTAGQNIGHTHSILAYAAPWTTRVSVFRLQSSRNRKHRN